MTLPARDLTDIAWALATARRAAGDDGHSPDWTDDDWRAELINHSVKRAGTVYFDPYAAALVFVSSPRNVAQRQEGSVQEQYTPPYIVVAQLEKLSAAWRLEVGALVPQTVAPALDLALTFGGW